MAPGGARRVAECHCGAPPNRGRGYPFWASSSPASPGVYEGVRHEAEGPVTTIWHREGGSWKLALVHSVSLPPPT
jgi:hypothetical protein